MWFTRRGKTNETNLGLNYGAELEGGEMGRKLGAQFESFHSTSVRGGRVGWRCHCRHYRKEMSVLVSYRKPCWTRVSTHVKRGIQDMGNGGGDQAQGMDLHCMTRGSRMAYRIINKLQTKCGRFHNQVRVEILLLHWGICDS